MSRSMTSTVITNVVRHISKTRRRLQEGTNILVDTTRIKETNRQLQTTPLFLAHREVSRL